MKNSLFFAVMAVMMLTGCFSDDDQLDITERFNQRWNVSESVVQNKDGSLTYYAVEWGGLVASLFDEDRPVDWTGYEQVVFEFAEPATVATQVLVNDKAKAWGSPGVRTLRCSLRGENTAAMEGLVLQTAKPTVLNIKRIYLSKDTLAYNSTAVWAGLCLFGDWTNGLNVPADRFESVREGDRLEFTYTTDTTNAAVTYWQIKTIFSDTDDVLQSNASELNGWGSATVDKNSHRYSITLNGEDAERLRRQGLFANGYYLNVTQCDLYH